jgi:serine/threonine protein kinase/tetratricopeptide (TPR) repeat protein
MSTDPKNLVGTTLSGRYKVERPIGEGGMGAVFEATQLSLGRRVAVKVVKPAAQASAAAVEDALMRFERETEVISRLNHPNIVQVVDAGRADDGTMYLAMELLEGESVRALLKREGSIGLLRALAITEDIASALVAAHKSGVIHRDLKSENVMLVIAAGKGETAKVLDFGVAKVTRQTEAPPVTGSGFVAGTPGCIAPEQMLGINDDPRSDLYSLGVLLFEMLAGQAPFSSPSVMELMLKHLTEPAPRVADVARARGRAEVPGPVDELVASLLAKDPDFRPASAEDLLAMLRNLRDASRATQPEVRVPLSGGSWSGASAPTPGSDPGLGAVIGSKVVSLPLAGTGAALGSGAPMSLPALAAATAPTAPTSPTTALPAGGLKWPARTRKKRAARIFTMIVVLGLAGYGALQVGRHFVESGSDRLSRNPQAEAALKRAYAAYWELNLEQVEHYVDLALQHDPEGAPMAWVLRSQVALLADRPLARADFALRRAAESASRRRIMARETHTEGLIKALSALEPQEAERLYLLHETTHHCYRSATENLHWQMFAVKMLVRSVNPAEDLRRFSEVGNRRLSPPRPATAFGEARALRGMGRIAEARALLTDHVLPVNGSPIVLHALAELDLAEGKRDEARARLEEIRRRYNDDLRANLQLAVIEADELGGIGRQDEDPFVRVRQRIDFLPPGEKRVDSLATLGYLLASRGRLREADAAWRAAIKEAGKTPEGVGRALELRGVAQLFSLNLGDAALAAAWREEFLDHRDHLSGNDPAAERLRAFSAGAKVLMDLKRSSDESALAKARDELANLRDAKHDIELIDDVVEWHLRIAEGRFDEAVRVSREQMPPCWRPTHEGAAIYFSALAARARGDVAAERAALARAKISLDGAVSLEHRDGCTAMWNILGFLQGIDHARSLAFRADVARLEDDKPTAAAMVKRHRQWWPAADEQAESQDLVRGVEAWLNQGSRP